MRGFSQLILATLTLLAAVPAHAAASQTPEQFVRSLYTQYTTTNASGLSEEDNVETRRIYEADLAQMIMMDYRKMQDLPGEPVLEFDPLVNGNDIEITGAVDVKVASQTATHATVVAKFTNAGTRQTLTYSLMRIAGHWKIHDIDWNGKGTLRGLFAHH